ncbi:hypothetical protein CALVIDRAFT_309012 [Calocera viscosa TUFC12733]|uniref:Uncharacterized protein n=1 Tax=Calocera viscosa (strain TUFC12733) TaxID=1330018 RepID=A0A167I795_CALVF|nr:hypothetical protein CALVIDRAFT_309012 [Calocera viscosa TUFC12733]
MKVRCGAVASSDTVLICLRDNVPMTTAVESSDRAWSTPPAVQTGCNPAARRRRLIAVPLCLLQRGKRCGTLAVVARNALALNQVLVDCQGSSMDISSLSRRGSRDQPWTTAGYGGSHEAWHPGAFLPAVWAPLRSTPMSSASSTFIRDSSTAPTWADEHGR